MARTTGNPRDFKQSDGPPGFRVPTQWLVVSVCFLSTVCVGEVMWTFGVFFTSFEQEFGWSRGLISAGYTSLMFGNSISLIVGGRLADRDAARQTMLTCAVIGAAAIALCSQIHSPLQLCLLFFMSGLGAGAFMSTPNSIVQRWFEGRPHSGLALSIVMAGVGVGGIIFAPVFRHLITVYGWRPTFMVAGGLFLLMAIAAGLWRTPYAHYRAHTVSPRQASETRTAEARPQRRILRPEFFVLTGVTVAGAGTFQVLSTHLVPYASDLGLSPTVSALALGLVGGASVPGRLITGSLAQRFGWRTTLVGSLLGTAGAVVCLMFVRQDWALITVVVVLGVFHGIRAVAVIGLLGRVFGMVSLGEVIGATLATAQVLSAPGPYIAGYWYDVTHSYQLMFIVFVAALVLGALATLRIPEGGVNVVAGPALQEPPAAR